MSNDNNNNNNKKNGMTLVYSAPGGRDTTMDKANISEAFEKTVYYYTKRPFGVEKQKEYFVEECIQNIRKNEIKIGWVTKAFKYFRENPGDIFPGNSDLFKKIKSFKPIKSENKDTKSEDQKWEKGLETYGKWVHDRNWKKGWAWTDKDNRDVENYNLEEIEEKKNLEKEKEKLVNPEAFQGSLNELADDGSLESYRETIGAYIQARGLENYRKKSKRYAEKIGCLNMIGNTNVIDAKKHPFCFVQMAFLVEEREKIAEKIRKNIDQMKIEDRYIERSEERRKKERRE